MDKINETAYKVDETATVPLAYHEMCETRHHKTVWRLIIGWAVSIIFAIGAFVFLWLQYDYTSSIDAQGVYVVTDANGNVIASDLEPEDVIHIMEGLADGENTGS